MENKYNCHNRQKCNKKDLVINFYNVISKKIQVIVKKINWFECSQKNIYIALIIYLDLCMFQVHPIFRVLIATSIMIKNLGWQFIATLAASIAYIVYDQFFPFFGSIAINSIVLGGALLYIEYKKIQTEQYDNQLKLLFLSMLATTIIDISMKSGWQLILYTYIKTEFPSSILRIFSVYIPVQLIVIINMIINRWKVSSTLVFNSAFFLGAVNYWTLAITNKEFSLSDIYLAKTVTTVISNVQVQRADILYFIFYILLVLTFNVAIWKIKWNNTKRKARIKQTVAAGIYLIAMIAIIISGKISNSTYKTYLKFGLISNLINGIEINTEPAGYDTYMEEIDAIIGTEQMEEPQEKVNVIMIMSEAFSDLSVIGEFRVTEDCISYTRELMQHTASGYVYSSVFGNNTSTSEYESLTGIPTALIHKTGGELYRSNMSESSDSIISYFKKLGYNTVGIHPFDGTGYNRESAWKVLGFDEMLFQESFKEAKYIRGYISDMSFYDKIIEKIEEEEEAQFIYGISMQNHATYLSDYEETIQLEDMNYETVNEYMSLLKETDKANKKLIEYFSNCDEKTMIIFYGDHQPMIEKGFYTEVIGTEFADLVNDEECLIYKIPYFVWTNYEANITVPEETSMNYLPNIIINALSYPRDEWDYFIEETRKYFPVITENFVKTENGYINTEELTEYLKSITTIETEDPYYMLKKYEVWSYNRALKK